MSNDKRNDFNYRNYGQSTTNQIYRRKPNNSGGNPKIAQISENFESGNRRKQNLQLNEQTFEASFVVYDLQQLKKNISSFNEKPQEKLYLISKEDFKNGIKLKVEINNNTIQQLNKKTTMVMNFQRNSMLNKIDFQFYSKYSQFKEILKKNDDFVLVKEEFLNLFVANKDAYEKKGILLIQNDGKKFLLFKDNILLDISGKENTDLISNPQQKTIKDNNDIYKENQNKIIMKEENKKAMNPEDNEAPYIFDINVEKINILKNLILIYAFEKNINDLINSSIKDEYDWNDYYLINKKWIEKYKNIFNFSFVKIYIDNMKLELNYKGYLIHLDNIAESLLSQNIFNKNNNYIKEVEKLQSDREIFDYTIQKVNFEKSEEEYDICFPSEFVFVPEKIFDGLIKIIDKSKNSKNECKYSILIGDNALFIKDKKFNNIFYIYELNKYYNFEISILFIYDEALKFYDEIKKYIKNKGIINYITIRKIKINKKGNINDLLNSGQEKIGNYINYKQLSEVEINKIKIKNNFYKNKIIYDDYQKFINSLSELKDKKININNIKDILNKKKDKLEVDYVTIFLTMKNHMVHLTNSLNFNQIEELKEIQDKEEFKKAEEKIINYLLQNNRIKEDAIKSIIILNNLNFNQIIRNNYTFTFFDLKFLKNFEDSLKNKNKPLEGYFFINNGQHFVYFFDFQKLFKIDYKNEKEKEFYLREYEFNKESKIILKILKQINENENNIEANISTNLKNISNSEYYYLINKQFMDNFKQHYNYDKIIQYINYDNETLYYYLNKNKDKYPINTNNFIPQNFFHSYTDLNIPINFCLLDTEAFEALLNSIAKNNDIHKRTDNIYKASFGDNKLFIQDISNKALNLIYSYIKDNNNNTNCELLYIIMTAKNQNLLNLLRYCDYNQTFEEFITSYGINLTETNPQVILDENFNELGNFYNIKVHNRIRLREPKHCLGLENIGATCYMNATLQCLCHVLNVKNYFKNRQAVYEDTNNKDCPLTLDFYKVVNNLWKDSYRGKKYYTPTDFKNRISEMNPLFKGIAANDSKDLILFLYETMHNEINKINQNLPTNNYNNNTELQLFRKNYYTKNSSFLIKTFYFEQQSDLKCLFCQFAKSSYNITNILIFPLEKVREYLVKKNPKGFCSVTLENCFENYQESEILSGMNQIYCNNCRRQANACTRNSMFTSPEVLTIILNRGKGLEFQVEFEYPLILNLDKFVHDKSLNNRYELIAVLTHIGPSGMAGHFIAFCKSPVDDKWYCYNDADVQEVIDPRQNNDDQIEGIPYVLFYQRYNSSSKKAQEKNYCDTSLNNYQKVDNYEKKKASLKKGYNKSYDFRKNRGEIWNNSYYNSSKKITLYFEYEQNEFPLDLNEDDRFYNVINKLNARYGVPKNVTLYYQRGNQLLPIEDSTSLKFHQFKDKDKITVI